MWTEFKVPKLKEGEDYKFRVRAENDQGVSEPLESEKSVRIKNPFGEFCQLLFLDLSSITAQLIIQSQYLILKSVH